MVQCKLLYCSFDDGIGDSLYVLSKGGTFFSVGAKQDATVYAPRAVTDLLMTKDSQFLIGQTKSQTMNVRRKERMCGAQIKKKAPVMLARRLMCPAHTQGGIIPTITRDFTVQRVQEEKCAQSKK